jgi:DNA-binding response OmpR family regulator
MRILVVEDEPRLREQLYQLLAEQKYDVDTAADGEKALDRLFDLPYDLVLMDIMLPKVDGFTVLRELRRAEITTPVLMLTAKGEIGDRVKGLDQGADDYLAKPFSPAELMARVRALLRRSSEHASPILQVDDIALNTVTREITKSGRPVNLTPKEFAMFEFLLYNKNHAVSRFNMAEHVWGNDFDPFEMSNYIDVHIKNIRKKLDDGHGAVIQTVRGIGYIIKDDGP